MGRESPPFVLFGPAHLVVLAITGALAVAGVRFVRREPGGRGERWLLRILALLTVAALVGGILWDIAASVSWTGWAPLQLCDVAVFLAADALVRRRQRSAELLWFWGIAASLPAMLTPDVHRAFPDPVFLLYFGQHAGVVISAVIAVFGLRLAPEPGAAGRCFLRLLGWAAVVGAVDALTGANFMYLRERPSSPTVLDWFGPWPWYLVGAGALGWGLFVLAELPFRPSRAAPRAGRPPGRSPPC